MNISNLLSDLYTGYDEKLEILNSPFSIDTHAKHFINYLEVILMEDGTIVYATPSHQEKLISIAMDKLGISRDELMDMCPKDMMLDVMTWLMDITGCVCIYTKSYMGKLNDDQLRSLMRLRDAGLYHGDIVDVTNWDIQKIREMLSN